MSTLVERPDFSRSKPKEPSRFHIVAGASAVKIERPQEDFLKRLSLLGLIVRVKDRDPNHWGFE